MRLVSCCLIPFSAAAQQEAAAAKEQTNGFKMDKAHTWTVCLFDDFDKLDKVPDEYQEAPPQEYEPVVRSFIGF